MTVMWFQVESSVFQNSPPDGKHDGAFDAFSTVGPGLCQVPRTRNLNLN